MKDIRYTKDYTLRRFLKELKEHKLYAKFLIAVAFYNTESRPKDLMDDFVRTFIREMIRSGSEHMYHVIAEWEVRKRYNDIII